MVASLDLTFLQMITGLLEQKQIQHVELTENKRIRLIGISQEAAHIVKEHGHIAATRKQETFSHVSFRVIVITIHLSQTTCHGDRKTTRKTRFYLQVTSIHIAGPSCVCHFSPIYDICIKKQLDEWDIYIGRQAYVNLSAGQLFLFCEPNG